MSLALQILNPDNEGKTALYHAHNCQSPKSFELMMSLLKNNTQIFASKLMLDVLPCIINSDNEEILNFFEYAIFSTPQMEIQ